MVLDEHKHNFDIHINHIEHEDVCGDSLRIQQVFVNLMSNAIKYTCLLYTSPSPRDTR